MNHITIIATFYLLNLSMTMGNSIFSFPYNNFGQTVLRQSSSMEALLKIMALEFLEDTSDHFQANSSHYRGYIEN